MSKTASRTIAEEVVRRCEGAQAITFEGGYAVHTGLRAGRVLFPPARTLKTTRNERGRCTQYVGVYSDGSKIRYTFSPATHRMSLKAFAPGVVS